jgi:hypothetical protein
LGDEVTGFFKRKTVHTTKIGYDDGRRAAEAHSTGHKNVVFR